MLTFGAPWILQEWACGHRGKKAMPVVVGSVKSLISEHSKFRKFNSE
jgi:hypothetical protein